MDRIRRSRTARESPMRPKYALRLAIFGGP